MPIVLFSNLLSITIIIIQSIIIWKGLSIRRILLSGLRCPQACILDFLPGLCGMTPANQHSRVVSSVNKVSSIKY